MLDYNASLFTGQRVNFDLEVGAVFSTPPDKRVKYYDANANGSYDNGEDIVRDDNMNGIFD